MVSTFVTLRLAGERVVYRADALTDETFELFSVPVDGSQAPVRLNASLVGSMLCRCPRSSTRGCSGASPANGATIPH